MSKLIDTFYVMVLSDVLFAYKKVACIKDEVGDDLVVIYTDVVTETVLDYLKRYARGKITFYAVKSDNSAYDICIRCYVGITKENLKITNNKEGK